MSDRSSRDFGDILEDFERLQDGPGGKPRERVIRQEPRAEPKANVAYRRPEGEDDFAAALAEFEGQKGEAAFARKSPEVGERVKGQILSMDLETALVDIGAKAEAVIPTDELADDDGILQFRAGDEVTAEVISVNPGGGLVLRPVGRGVDPRHGLEVGDVVEGLVTGVNKGGAEVEVKSLRAFCPVSQLADRYVEDSAEFVGRRLRFRVERYEPGGGGRRPNVVLSRKVLLQEEKAAKAEAVRATLTAGALVRGKVTALADYGAFIDLGGLEGLMHVSELSHRRVAHPSELLKVGQEVEVRITKLEQGKDGRDRVSLSMKALERDPWLDAVSKWAEGTVATGKVMRLEAFGAFVELEPGVEGLVHISELGGGRRIHHPREVLEKGQGLAVRVLGVDGARKRISLQPVEGGEGVEDGPSVRELLDQHRSTGEGFGAMAAFFEKGGRKKG